jgi:hypothetical protein
MTPAMPGDALEEADEEGSRQADRPEDASSNR